MTSGSSTVGPRPHPGVTAGVEGRDYRTGSPVRVSFRDGRIAEIERLADAGDETGPWIGPGLVDLQLNGYRGLDLNRLPLAPDLVERLAVALWSEGITSFLPTLVSNGDEAIEQALAAISAACSRSSSTRAAIAGVHLEGPFISPEDGPRGAHNAAHVKGPDWELLRRWQDAAEGMIRMITVAPEWPGAMPFVARCIESGLIVAIGHTAATAEQIRDAVAAGARISTHLGNGAHPLLPRHPTYLWEQLAQDELWASVIADGFHLPDSVIKVILKVKGARTIVVSDAVCLSGMPPGDYEMPIGGKVVLTPAGKLHLRQSPELLAGSAQMLPAAMSNLVCRGLASLPDAWEMCSVRPSLFLDLPTAAGLDVGAPGDLVAVESRDGAFAVSVTYKAGEPVFAAVGTG
jgi:N-acetylglucosamine-6-phosphate deacetylase